MIYDLLIQTKKGKKQMYLSAVSVTALYKRCWDMYLVPKSDIFIQREIDESELDINIISKPAVTQPVEEQPSEKAVELFNNVIRGLSEAEIQDRCNKGFELKNIEFNIDTINTLCKHYKKVKLYYRRTGAKKNKEYIALVK